MPLHSVLVHDRGPALWPDHKPLEEVELLRETTPTPTWEATYQGRASPPGGTVFRRSWWPASRRYDYGDRGLVNAAVARYISWDTGQKADPAADHDPSAGLVADLWPDYRLAIRFAHVERLEFPDLPGQMEELAGRYNGDRKLRAVLVEDKSSGTSALQTLAKSSAEWLRPLLVPFIPTTDKITRAQQAAVWARNGCIMLPRPSMDPALAWLADLEEELFSFPQWPHDDQVDAFSQMILYLENILQAGYEARGGG